MKKIANLVLVFAGMVLGCAAGGAAVQHATAQSQPPPQPPPTPQRWQQICEFGGEELDQLNPHLARRGGRGMGACSSRDARGARVLQAACAVKRQHGLQGVLHYGTLGRRALLRSMVRELRRLGEATS